MGIPLEIITGEHSPEYLSRVTDPEYLRTHLAVSGEGCVPGEELQQAGHGVQVLLALPALPRLATRVRVGTVL